MFHIGRCGSTILADLLSQHREIHWAGEINGSHFYNRHSLEFEKKILSEDQGEMHLRRSMRGMLNKYFGIEVKRIHMEWMGCNIPDYLQKLVRNGFDKFIILERINYLRTILSYTIAQRTGIWHTHNELTGPEPIDIDLDNVRLEYHHMPLLDALETIDTFYADVRTALRDAGIIPLELTYELDIQDDPMIGYRKIESFLDLSAGIPKVRFKRTNPFTIEKLVLNNIELISTLKHTKYSWMIS